METRVIAGSGGKVGEREKLSWQNRLLGAASFRAKPISPIIVIRLSVAINSETSWDEVRLPVFHSA